MRREISEVVKTVFEMNVEGSNGKEKRKKSDLRIAGVNINNVRNCTK